jgi:hypothetical protein
LIGKLQRCNFKIFRLQFHPIRFYFLIDFEDKNSKYISKCTYRNTLLEEPLHSCSRRRVVAADGGGRERAPWTVQHGRPRGGVCRTGQVARGTSTVQTGGAVAAAAAAGAGTRRPRTVPAGTRRKNKSANLIQCVRRCLHFVFTAGGVCVFAVGLIAASFVLFRDAPTRAERP